MLWESSAQLVASRRNSQLELTYADGLTLFRGKVVPKRLDHLAVQEVQALQEVKRAGVSRVANLLDGLDGSTHLVLEYDPGGCNSCCNIFTRRCNLDFSCRLVDRFDLYQYTEWRNETSSFSNVEGKMLTVAVQLIKASSLSCWLVL